MKTTDMKITEKDTEQLIQRFADKISEGIIAWVEAGIVVVQLVDEHNLTVEQIAERTGGACSANVVARFEQIGRKQIIPELLVADYPAARKLIRLTYSEQKRLLSNPVSVVVVNEGRTDTLLIAVEDLTQGQCKQVFDGAAIRSLASQKAWIESQRTEAAITSVQPQRIPYIIHRGKVLFRADCELTTKEIARLLAELSAQ